MSKVMGALHRKDTTRNNLLGNPGNFRMFVAVADVLWLLGSIAVSSCTV